MLLIQNDPVLKAIYSVDASIYQIEPEGVAIPQTLEELLELVEYCAKSRTPLIARGAATGIAGGCIGKGIVVDLARHFNQILEIDLENRRVRAEPGVVQKQLNDVLKPHGYRLGPDTSTGNRATLGGMLANNSAGARSLQFGRMIDAVEEVELLLSDGRLVRLNWESKGALVDGIASCVARYEEEIQQRFPRVPRHVNGYALDALLAKPFNPAKVLAGSEGTLGIVTEMTLAITPLPKRMPTQLLFFSSFDEAFHSVPQLLSFRPQILEMLDDKIVEAGRQAKIHDQALSLIKGDPKAIFMVETEADLALHYGQEHCTLLTRDKDQEAFMKMREAGLGLLLSKRSYSRAIAFLEDLSVAPERLGPFMGEFMALLKKHGKEAGVYGHAGAGCMHIRPYIDLRDPAEVRLMRALMEQTADLILRYHGALSGEHGDGLVRSWLTERLFGPKLMEAFKEIKELFDPLGMMNPGKIIPDQPFEENLRKGPVRGLKTEFRFEKDGGIELAADLCNGNGACRKREGVMCPTFQATGDEYQTTRARAQTLRSYFNGTLPASEWLGEEMHAVLDHCIECKGCQTECPSHVDMAKMKSEFLYHYQLKHGVSWRSWIFGHIPALFALASPFSGFVNWLNQSTLSKKASRKLGIAAERSLPKLARERFSSWVTYQMPLVKSKGTVVLFNDTYTQYICPEVGKGAYRLLNSLGYEVIVPPRYCCGRPLISKGLLKEAKTALGRLAAEMRDAVVSGLPIIVLEPSCLSVLRDEMKDLIGEPAFGVSLEQFLIENQELKALSALGDRSIQVHTHCHQKALWKHSDEIYRALGVEEIVHVDSSCCGMAGSFGYEKEHYELSMKIAKDRLLPQLWGEVILANGFSCRSQIEHAVGKKALHFAEWAGRPSKNNGSSQYSLQ